MSAVNKLVWNPLGDYLRPKLQACTGVKLFIAPFIQKAALATLVEACADVSLLRVITRWNACDVASGVSDLEVYPYLKSKGVKLYVHKSIHLKLFVLDQNVAFTASGNITGRGIGLLGGPGNVEVGCEAPLALADWLKIHEILEDSIAVDEAVYGKAKAFKNSLPSQNDELPMLNLEPATRKAFSWLSLPASENPEALFEFYETLNANIPPSKDVAVFMHDLVLYRIPQGLGRSQFFELLRGRFVQHPFIVAVVKLLKKEKTARFGLVNEWLQRNCSDKPTPFRWELKTTTRRLYDWLAYFYPEINWDQPNHSMILRWGISEAE